MRTLGLAVVVHLALALVSGTAPAAAQIIEYTDTYPFHQARAVVAENDGGDVTIYEGAGSGIFVLDETGLEPSLKSGVANELEAKSFVRDLALTDTHVYAATHRAGLTRFRRDTLLDNPDIEDDRVTDAWAVDVPTNIGGFDLVLVGTNNEFDSFDMETGGALHLMSIDTVAPLEPPTLLDTLEFGAPVYAIESMVDGNTVTVLVGTACREDNAVYNSLLRFDLDITSGIPSALPTLAQASLWNPPDAGTTEGRLIDDIVIDTDDPLGPHAYVADFSHGIYKVDLTNGLATAASSAYPLTAGSAYYRGLDLHSDPGSGLGTLLVAGLSEHFEVERTVWGDCSTPGSCDGSGGERDNRGVAVFDVGSSSPAEIASFLNNSVKTFSVSSYLRNGKLVIAVAGLQAGLVMLEYSSANPDRLTQGGRWNHADGVPMGQFDDVLRLSDNLFVAAENTLCAFDVTNETPTTLFDEPVDVVSGGAVVLAGYEAFGEFPTAVFAATIDRVVAYEIQGSGPTAQILNRGDFLATRDPTDPFARTYSVAVIPPTHTVDGFPWLVAINQVDSATSVAGQTNGSVQIYRVVLNGRGEIDIASLDHLGAYAPSPADTTTGSLIGGAAIAETYGARVVVAYSPTESSLPPGNEEDAGLLFLHFDYDDGGTTGLSDDKVTVNSAQTHKAVAFPGAVSAPTALMNVYGHHGWITAAFGCNGVAAYSMGGESLVDKYPGVGSAPSAFMDAILGQNQAIYATTIDGRIWAFDVNDMSVPLGVFETRGQAAFLEPAVSTVPGSPPPPAWYLTDFRSGLHRIQFLSHPGP